MRLLVPKEFYIRVSVCNLSQNKCLYIKVIDTSIQEAAIKINEYLTGMIEQDAAINSQKTHKITLREFNKSSGNGKQWSKTIKSYLTEKQIISYLKNKINEENGICFHPGSVNCANDCVSTRPKNSRTNSH